MGLRRRSWAQVDRAVYGCEEHPAYDDLLFALEAIVKSTENWNAAVETIIGKQPDTGIDLRRAKEAIARARA